MLKNSLEESSKLLRRGHYFYLGELSQQLSGSGTLQYQIVTAREEL